MPPHTRNGNYPTLARGDLPLQTWTVSSHHNRSSEFEEPRPEVHTKTSTNSVRIACQKERQRAFCCELKETSACEQIMFHKQSTDFVSDVPKTQKCFREVQTASLDKISDTSSTGGDVDLHIMIGPAELSEV
jgi:hypothetical protein